ncbi:hypothetical protein [Aurantiacibacter gilvus]|uniref:TonB C-terminal domain-containing protein n=1 Tax=Aurantiacibacter gilvus TaxID=3139141 RepID=A0ABU9I9U8_9SPHN
MVRLLFTALAALALTPIVAAAQARQLAPASEWSLHETDEYCRISRSFGSGSHEVTMYFYSYGPTGSYQVILVGPNLPRNDAKARVAMLAWGGSDDTERTMVINSRLGDNGSLTFRTYGNRPVMRFGRAWSAEWDDRYDLPFDSRATQLTIGTGELDPITLQLGDMAAPLRQLADCELGLLPGWGFSADDYLGLQGQPSLLNGQDVVEIIRWPAAVLLNRNSMFLQLRMTVDPEGRAQDCVVQSPALQSSDQRAICREFTRSARFTPATDAEGNAVAAPFRASNMMFVFD